MRESRYAIVLCTTSLLGTRNRLDVDFALRAHDASSAHAAFTTMAFISFGALCLARPYRHTEKRAVSSTKGRQECLFPPS
jgi:hypothetical protein